MSTWNGTALGILRTLVEPHAAIVDPRRRRIASAVLVLTLSLLTLNTIAGAAYWILSHSLAVESLASEAVFLAAYLLARGREPGWGSGLLVVSLSALIFVFTRRSIDPVHGLLWVVVPISAAAIVLSTRAAAVVAVLDCAGVVAYIAMDRTISIEEAATSVLIVTFTTLVSMGAKGIRQRDARALERQARELGESRERYRSLLNDVPIGLYETTPSGQVLDANPACVELLGFADRETLLRTNTPDLYVDAGRREQWRDAMEREGSVRDSESRLRRPDGKTIWVRESARAIRGPTEVLSYRGSIEDITESKLVQTELEQRNLELATLNALAQALSSSLKLGDMLDEALSRVVHILGYAGGLISQADQRTGDLAIASYAGLPLSFVGQLEVKGLGGTLCDRVYQTGKQLVIDDLAQDADEGTSRLVSMGFRSYAGTPIVRQGRAVGTLCLFDTTPHHVSETEPMLLTAIGQQIGVAAENARLFGETQQRVRELQLVHDVSLAAALGPHLEETQQAATEALAGALPGTRVALLLLDSEGRTLSVQASTGYTADVVRDLNMGVGEGIAGWVARHGQPVLVPDVRLDLRYVEIAGDTRSKLCVPLTLGSQVIGVLNVEHPQANAFTTDDQRLLGVLANSLAVLIERARLFEQVQAARAELQARADELARANARLEELAQVKSEFLAHMSHELRTPLTAILGFAQLMLRSPSLAADHRKSLAIIHSSGEHLLDLINDVLDMAKIESGRITFDPTDLDLDLVLHNILSMMNARAEEKGLALDFYRAPDVPRYVRTDERKLRQVLLNLLGNAIKFTAKGGVALRVSYAAERETPTSTAGPMLRFEVQDTGVGIAPGEMDSLFQAFSQTASGKQSQEGTGLGLPISRRFVQVMGGDLTASSQFGRGSTFAFEVPIGLAETGDVTVGHRTRQVIGLEPGQPTYRVLVADDRAENRMLVRQLLETVGFEAKEAANGEEAVALCESWHPHLILMDMRMPVMDGYEATQRIRASAEGQATIIVALTASALEEERSAILAVGCDDYIRKPFRDADLFARLAHHLGARYTYADEGESAEKEGGRAAQEPLTSQTLAALPAEWIVELHDAAGRGRADLILNLVARMEHEYPLIAGGLAQLVDEFRFDRIMRLTERQEGVQP